MAFQKRWQKTTRLSAHTSRQAFWAHVLQLPPKRLPKPNHGSTKQTCPQTWITAVGSDLTHVNDLRFQLRSHPALPPRLLVFRVPSSRVRSIILGGCPSLALQTHTSQGRAGQAPPAQPANRSDALTPRVQRQACTAQAIRPCSPA